MAKTPSGTSPARRRRAPRGPVCGYAFDGAECAERGEHLCAPRVAKVTGFFAEVLVHTKGRWARQRFVLAAWQAADIVAPLFGTVAWSAEAGQYVRRYRVVWVELPRKNGKSELLAGIALYLLVADDEEGAEIYGCARDRDQARKVFDVAERMVRLSRVLSRRLKIYAQAKRIVDERSGSYYEIVAADAAGNLGHNPHGVVLDEVITQRDGGLWDAMRTAMGARTQPVMIAATTAGSDGQSFAKAQHDEMQRVADDPGRAPHVLAVMRNTPHDADPWDESGWAGANPALGDFLSLQALRDEALEARAEPRKENSFRQFRLNQWVSQATRWMPMDLWDECPGEPWLGPEWARERLGGRAAYAGFDLAAKLDLVAWCLLFPPEDGDPHGDVHLAWRFWLPAAGAEALDRLHGGQFTRWAKAGWVTVTDGAVVDYDRVVADVARDAAAFTLLGAHCDEWSMWPVIGRVAEACGLDPEGGDVAAYRNTYDRMSPGMSEIMGLARDSRLAHHANPVARFCFDYVEVRAAPYDPNLIRPVKPNRQTSHARIDAVPTAAMAANAWRAQTAEPRASAYEDGEVMIL
jgi:phage terminase large subunit-like protein